MKYFCVVNFRRVLQEENKSADEVRDMLLD